MCEVGSVPLVVFPTLLFILRCIYCYHIRVCCVRIIFIVLQCSVAGDGLATASWYNPIIRLKKNRGAFFLFGQVLGECHRQNHHFAQMSEMLAQKLIY